MLSRALCNDKQFTKSKDKSRQHLGTAINMQSIRDRMTHKFRVSNVPNHTCPKHLTPIKSNDYLAFDFNDSGLIP